MPYLSYSTTAPETRKGFKAGDRIEFTGIGTIKELHGHDGCFLVQDDTGYQHYVYPSSSKVTLKATDPVNWPPQVGDVWKAGGSEYFARKHNAADGQVVLVSEGGTLFYRSDFPVFIKKSPTLIRRRGL